MQPRSLQWHWPAWCNTSRSRWSLFSSEVWRLTQTSEMPVWPKLFAGMSLSPSYVIIRKNSCHFVAFCWLKKFLEELMKLKWWHQIHKCVLQNYWNALFTLVYTGLTDIPVIQNPFLISLQILKRITHKCLLYSQGLSWFIDFFY